MKRLIAGLLLVILLTGTVACARAPEPMPAPAPMPPVIPAPESIFGGSDKSQVVTAPAPAPAPTEDNSGQFPVTDRMIVRTGEMALVVTDVADTMEKIVQLAQGYEGYVVSSNSWREDSRLVGNIAIRVAAEHFNDAVRALRDMAEEVKSESSSSTDVTEEYVDLSAKLRNLEAAEAQLLKLMEEEAEKVTDILEIQRELVRTRDEIERTKGRLQYLEQSSSTSIIQVRLEQSELDVRFSATRNTVKTGQDIRFEPRIAGGFSPYSYEWDFGDGNTSTDAVPTHDYQSDGSYTVTLTVTDDRSGTASQTRDNYIVVLPGWSAGNTVSSAWNGLAAFGRVLTNILIWLGIFSPLWLVIAVILYFAWWRRRKKA